MSKQRGYEVIQAGAWYYVIHRSFRGKPVAWKKAICRCDSKTSAHKIANALSKVEE